MTQRFIIRLLDAGNNLLGWADVFATAKPQERPAASCPFYVDGGQTHFLIEQAGRPAKVSIHWVDLDVARVQDITHDADAQFGQMLTLSWIEPVWLVPGMRDVPLPAVTVRAPVSVRVPVGGMGAVSPR